MVFSLIDVLKSYSADFTIFDPYGLRIQPMCKGSKECWSRE
jgi:hypothetical protein